MFDIAAKPSDVDSNFPRIVLPSSRFKFDQIIIIYPVRILFLLYLNDIANVCPGENVKLFADDTNLFISGIDSCVLNQKCNDCSDILHRWFVANRMTLGENKYNGIS